ncbi:MAG: hypothetical protein NTW13_00225 [Candidatus Omnitrophica bacterium]|nr:hypothetical protein [Candidatus Omnitrophota bacterium]
MSANKDRKSWFESNPKKTIGGVVIFIIIISVILLEFILRIFFGLGNPILYDSNPFYGYRLLPHQNITRFYGTKIIVNNLGLRADEDWDSNRNKKVLFLGDSVTYGGSYIANKELFSTLAINKFKDYHSGNGGINGWGVENAYGLVVESNFLPAEICVSIFIEGDFYRGLAGISGLPFFNKKPKFALEELVLYYMSKFINNRRYLGGGNFSSEKEIEAVVDKAARKLNEMDAYLKSKGIKHVIFISPSREQVILGRPKDERVEKAISKYRLNVNYILDRQNNVYRGDKAKLFYDGIHLSKLGHKIWAEIIQDELVRVVSNDAK